MTYSEEILVTNIKRNDRDAQKTLYHKYANRLLYLSIRYVGREEIAEDILHDSFIKIFNEIGKFKFQGEGSLRAWMDRITINTSLEWLRNNKKLEFVPLDSEYNLIDEPSYSETEIIPRDKLMQLINELPDGYRTVFNLFCIEEYSHKEIAAKLNINEKSSSSQLLRAKRLLATKIKEYLMGVI
ncbi:MAG: RNA polymerase sigma factor [Bacteroidales bacterium]